MLFKVTSCRDLSPKGQNKPNLSNERTAQRPIPTMYPFIISHFFLISYLVESYLRDDHHRHIYFIFFIERTYWKTIPTTRNSIFHIPYSIGIFLRKVWTIQIFQTNWRPKGPSLQYIQKIKRRPDIHLVFFLHYFISSIVPFPWLFIAILKAFSFLSSPYKTVILYGLSFH